MKQNENDLLNQRKILIAQMPEYKAACKSAVIAQKTAQKALNRLLKYLSKNDYALYCKAKEFIDNSEK